MSNEQVVQKLALNFVHEWREVSIANRRGMVRAIYALEMGSVERRGAMRGLRMVQECERRGEV